MKIKQIIPCDGWILKIIAEDGRVGRFDVAPYLEAEAFAALRDKTAFARMSNGGYFIEWECGADLSADTIEARWQLVEQPLAASTCQVSKNLAGLQYPNRARKISAVGLAERLFAKPNMTHLKGKIPCNSYHSQI